MYNLASKLIHWLMALMVFALLPIGYIMVDLNYYSPWYQILPNWHYIIGLVFSAVLILRVINRLWIDKHEKFTEKPAHYGHMLIYIFMFGCAISGYILGSDSLWFLPSVYDMMSVNREAVHLAHKIFTYGLGLLILGHVAMALVHQFILKQPLIQRIAAR